MGKQIIILDKNVHTGQFTCVLWADVPLDRQPLYVNALATSFWKGASSAEHAAIASGQVTERVIDLAVPDGATNAQIRDELIIQQARFQADITAANPQIRYGAFFDGEAWVAGGVL